jgi:hypothetical protein
MCIRVRSDHGLVSSFKDDVWRGRYYCEHVDWNVDTRFYDDVAEIWAGRDLSTDEALSATFIR